MHGMIAIPLPRRIDPTVSQPLHGLVATRRLEHLAAAGLPPHTLMARAGLSLARLARAVAPHARRIWVACGPGNNGGDGLVAAAHLHRWGGAQVVVTQTLGPSPLPADAEDALAQARAAGVNLVSSPPDHADLALDALLGLGALRPPDGPMEEAWRRLGEQGRTVLAVDLPSGLDADTGHFSGSRPTVSGSRHTLSLLTLKPGLWTGVGRALAGTVWFDDLGVTPTMAEGWGIGPDAWLTGQPFPYRSRREACPLAHKGSFGDVWVLGGQDATDTGVGMTGAAVLAARAALHGGAGRVYLALLGTVGPRWDPACPELMMRSVQAMMQDTAWQRATVVAGCGGGTAIAPWLPDLMTQAARLVLDADALNAVAADPALANLLQRRGATGGMTVLTPHPLEAARLLNTDTATVMSDRPGAARALSQRFMATVVLKGSGTLVQAPGETLWINPTGNASLGTAGTGDVLAGLIGASLAASPTGRDADANIQQTVAAVTSAVYQHGWWADHWSPHSALTADALARRLQPCG